VNVPLEDQEDKGLSAPHTLSPDCRHKEA